MAMRKRERELEAQKKELEEALAQEKERAAERARASTEKRELIEKLEAKAKEDEKYILERAIYVDNLHSTINNHKEKEAALDEK